MSGSEEEAEPAGLRLAAVWPETFDALRETDWTRLLPVPARGWAARGLPGDARRAGSAGRDSRDLRHRAIEVTANAGIASSARIEETTLAEWERNHAILGTGYFLVGRAGFRIAAAQGTGGSMVLVASKNALVAGKGAAAYSSAKASELHLARCLAEEGGELGRCINVVNVNILPEDIAQAVLHFASPARSAKSTGNVLNVDGGVPGAYPR